MAVTSGMARCALGSLLLSISLTLSLAWAGPMDLAGQFSVSESGAATYSIPIAVPPGTGGIEPKLALSYNSQTGSGLLGMGWSLSGLSAVTRCSRTIAQDGVTGGINFDANDRLCLDGQRLVAINGVYGADGTEYRTERESFSKIISYGTAGNGPAWFKVWTKAGQILEYGNTADSRIEAQGKTSARVWAINKITDTKGNYLTFIYTEDSTNGDYVPTRIDYTGNAGASLSPNNSVRFVYETRPDSVPGYFAGSLVKSMQRLTTVRTYAGNTLVKEYRLAYASSPSSNRSRLTSLTECALPDNSCKPPLSLTWSEFGANSFGTGSSWTSLAAGFLADVNGDGRSDMVAQQSDGLYVAVSTGTGVGSSSKWASSFGSGQGYADQNLTPIFLVDVNSDGLADAIGVASDGVYVALSNGNGFNTSTKWLSDFGTANGWTNMDTYPRTLADVNGDGRLDIVGFKNDGVYVSLNTGSGFATATKWSSDFGTASTVTYATNAANPRLIQDMNGDGLPDIVGFASGGVYVGLNTGSGFAASTLWLANFGITAGYTTQDTYPRTLADVNGDGLADIVGFKNDGVYVAINTGIGLQTASKWVSDFGTATATAYSTQKGFPRYVLDVNGDGKADIVGFAANGVQVALGTGIGFNASSQWVAGFGSAAGYGTTLPRQVADLDGDGFADVVGTLTSGTSVALSARSVPPDWVTAFAPGLGLSTTLSYDALTKPGVYTRGNGAVYPQMDLNVPLYVVSLVRTPNGLGTGYVLNYYQYGDFRVDLSGRGALGFGWQQMLQTDSSLALRTDFRQDWPYQGLPAQTTKRLPGTGNGGLLSLAVNTYACTNPQTGAACTMAAGNRYFPYALQTIEAAWDANGAALPVVATSNTFDAYGNATQVAVTTEDGFTKTTTNTYSNDTTNWILGRLGRSQVASEATGSTVPNMSLSEFIFTQTISSNTQNYNLKVAAIAAGWNQALPLKATITINSGAIVGSTTTSAYAFETGAAFPAGSTLALINNGSILGAGGAGGKGQPNGTNGGAGGGALNAQAAVSVTNNGTIGGGGGGGAGGGTGGSWCLTGGGGGGGGAGSLPGSGGPVGTNVSAGQAAGAAGTTSAGGIGGYAALPTSTWGSAGNGGEIGSSGTSGSASCSPLTAPGVAGPAVIGNANITWLSTGTRLGSVVAGSAEPLTIVAIVPNAGALAGGMPVTLIGTGFLPGATTVSIGGTAAVACTVSSSTQMSCLTPAGTPGAKDVVISAAGATQTLTNAFTYQTLAVTAIAPNVGSFAGGTPILLTGTGFAPGTLASIGGAAATSCTVISSTSMTCLTAPNSVGVKNVVVGLDETSATLANGFTYQGLALTSVTPNQGSAGGGTAVTLTGTGFAPSATVMIGGIATTGCSVASLTSMTCNTQTPPPVNTAGVKDVTVSLAGSTTTLVGGFTYQATITSILPNQGSPTGGTRITLTGNGFGTGATVTVGGVAATACSVAGSTSMACTTPAGGAGVKDVTVSLAGSTTTLVGGFTYSTNFVFTPAITSNTTNYNLRTAAIAAGWNQTMPLIATVTINAGVTVGGSGSTYSAFETGGGFPGGSTLALIVNGSIQGKGGSGGSGPGGAGGSALRAQAALSVTNNGIIGGGGGGGGGGHPGMCGNYGGYGGAGAGNGVSAANGSPGQLVNCPPWNSGGSGGAGGALGSAGGTGEGYSGGNPGAAVIGNSDITWITTGTRLGALQ